MARRLKVGLIGCGKVGVSFARLLKGIAIVGIYDSSKRRLNAAAKIFKKKKKLPETMVMVADIILIATPDDQIEPVARNLRKMGFKKTIVHFSGLLPSKVLGLKNRVSIHPLGSFADFKMAYARMKEAVFIIEGDRSGLKAGRQLIKSFSGSSQIIKPEDKPYYHLACVLSSNFLVALFSMVEKLKAKRGLRVDMLPLFESTIENLRSFGTKEAATGPIIRGDIETVKAHVRMLKKLGIDYRLLYLLMSRELLTLGSSDNKDLLSGELSSLFHQ
ncbi:MAG TPA: DUF2520 domain-containing protein [bacterium (Candidatus Stahlbacteria)]|nr:DUF2520 domain-containing protein [Candidatus Stahlbacteria bacterium]